MRILFFVLPALLACGSSKAPQPTNSSPTLAASVSLTSPSADVVVNTSLSFQGAVSGFAGYPLVLLRDGQPFAALAPPYTYVWDASHEPEATYEFRLRFAALVNVDSNAVHVTVDHSRPYVIARTPSAGASNVRSRVPITVQFSEAVQGISETSVMLTDDRGADLPETVALSSDGLTLTVTPGAAPETLPGRVRLTLGDGIVDHAGNALASVSWDWEVPAWVTAPVGGVEDSWQEADFATTSDGTTYLSAVRYLDDGSSTTTVYRRAADNAWSATGDSVSGAGRVGAQDTRLRMSVYHFSLTSQTVSLLELAGSSWNLLADHLEHVASGTWQSVGLPSAPVGSSNGTYVAVSAALASQQSDVYLGTYQDNTGWQLVTAAPTQASPSTPSFSPSVLVTPHGPLVSWQEGEATAAVYAELYDGTTPWLAGSNGKVSFSAAAACAGSALLSTGDIVVTYCDAAYYALGWFSSSVSAIYPGDVPTQTPGSLYAERFYLAADANAGFYSVWLDTSIDHLLIPRIMHFDGFSLRNSELEPPADVVNSAPLALTMIDGVPAFAYRRQSGDVSHAVLFVAQYNR